ncbi:hypothetical protein [Pseudoalteromonas luteoviolacea]|uniref:Lipoprotein n=1 Tax=Pseudoalteromonas luteoviolacea DSM 6061 TaxID=1365250 RepID=A0A166W3A3_9GAMM|nr:hypothetical protein [Pseudoalteromonas luteoviolacea]KZN35362.1 hypothetical protein N475_18645 [Pseudoalteromonas luteoviolacea DSM 6061]
MTKPRLLTVFLALLVSACHSSNHSQPLPAVLSATSPSVILELQQAVVTLKGGQPPTLAHNVLTHSPQLIITSGQLTSDQAMLTVDLSQLPISAFELQLRENLCVLYYSKADKFVPLRHAQCVEYRPE